MEEDEKNWTSPEIIEIIDSSPEHSVEAETEYVFNSTFLQVSNNSVVSIETIKNRPIPIITITLSDDGSDGDGVPGVENPANYCPLFEPISPENMRPTLQENLSPEIIVVSDHSNASPDTEAPGSNSSGESRKKVRKITSCEHLEHHKRNGGLKNYAKIHVNLISSLVEKTRELKSQVGKCFTCRRIDGSLHACLHCIFIGCLKGSHSKNHFKETGHPLVCDLTYGTTYCYKCTDFLFDRDLEEIAQSNDRKSEWIMNLPYSPKFVGISLADLFLHSGLRSSCLSPKTTLGLRGLVNLGHTCFMNCIMQAMIHTPLLRDFFFTERIVCHERHDREQLKPCVITFMYDLYQKFYDGSTSAVSLHNLLHKIWGNAAHLAGYEQQDAHEFFIAILDALHLHFTVPGSKNACKCVIDLIFSGKFQSAVTCIVCGRKSITVDPFWDISLDLVVNPVDPNGAINLDDCLKRYTRVEHLGSSGMIWCSHCKNNQESTKQLKFQVLPVILCLHLKRFEHSTNYKKIDNWVRFPEHLDLAPFTSDFEDKQSVSRDRIFALRNKESDYKYSLYAVVNHIGSLEGGHYYSFIRPTRDEWYKCDDHIITKVSREDALRSPGYLLFYHKEGLFYDDASKTLPTSC